MACREMRICPDMSLACQNAHQRPFGSRVVPGSTPHSGMTPRCSCAAASSHAPGAGMLI